MLTAMRKPWFAALALLCCCDGDPISGTWRSDAIPTVVLELDDELTGTLTLDEIVYRASAIRDHPYEYTVQRCPALPEGGSDCTEHRCQFDDDDDDLFDDDDDGPDLTSLTCDLGGRDRVLHAD
jgi:hypothetical protein